MKNIERNIAEDMCPWGIFDDDEKEEKTMTAQDIINEMKEIADAKYKEYSDTSKRAEVLKSEWTALVVALHRIEEKAKMGGGQDV